MRCTDVRSPNLCCEMLLTHGSILDSCVGSIQAQLNSCDSNDYSCLCAGYINMLTCYDNCPNDTGASTVQQQRTQNCNAASVYSSTTVLSTAPATSAASSGASSATSTSSSAAVESGSASGTSSGSSSTPSETGTSGAENVKAAGGLLALVFAGAAALL